MSCHVDHSGTNRTRLWWVLGFSSIYFIAEVIGGLLSGSLALLADAGHMITDVAAVALGIFALWIAAKPPNDAKTFGYYRAEILAALVHGAALIAVCFWILVEAWKRLSQPPEIQGALMSAVAAGGLLVNLLSLAVTHGSRHQSLNLRGVWLHIVSDTLGSLSALIGGFLVWQYDWYLADPIISCLIAVLILGASWNLLREAVNILLEGVPKGIEMGALREGIQEIEGVDQIHDLHVWSMATGVHSLSAHVKIADGADHKTVLEKIHSYLKEKHHIEHATLQLEPSNYSHSDLHP